MKKALLIIGILALLAWGGWMIKKSIDKKKEDKAKKEKEVTSGNNLIATLINSGGEQETEDETVTIDNTENAGDVTEEVSLFDENGNPVVTELRYVAN